MTLLLGIKILGIVATVLLGSWTLVKTKMVKGFTGLDPATPKGEIEIRVVMGGAMVGLGIAALVFPVSQVYKTISIVFITITVIRGILMVSKKSIDKTNLISFLAGGVLAVIFYL